MHSVVLYARCVYCVDVAFIYEMKKNEKWWCARKRVMPIERKCAGLNGDDGGVHGLI